MQKLKIAILCNTSWNIYNFRLNLVKEILKTYKVLLIAPEDKYTSLLEDIGVEFHHIKINTKGQNPVEEVILINDYLRILKNTRPDLLLTFTIKPTLYGNIAARFLGIRSISNITGLGTIFIKKSMATRIAAVLYRFALGNCSKVYFQNQADYRLFRLKKLVREKQAEVIPGSGVDTSKFDFIERDFKPEALKFLFVGRILRDKGIVELLEAVKDVGSRHPEISLQIVGQLGYENKTALSEEELLQYVDNKIIHYTGQTDTIIEQYRRNNVMVLPSYREGMSRALLEAASTGMPIITTNVPGCREIVREGQNGYLVKPRSAHDLIEKIEHMLSLKKVELIKMGEASRVIVLENFSEKLVVNRYVDDIRSLNKYFNTPQLD